MINKNEFKKLNDKEILHKSHKNWVVISLALLGIVGGTTGLAKQVHADTNNGGTQPDTNRLNVDNGQAKSTLISNPQRSLTANHSNRTVSSSSYSVTSSSAASSNGINPNVVARRRAMTSPVSYVQRLNADVNFAQQNNHVCSITYTFHNEGSDGKGNQIVARKAIYGNPGESVYQGLNNYLQTLYGYNPEFKYYSTPNAHDTLKINGQNYVFDNAKMHYGGDGIDDPLNVLYGDGGYDKEPANLMNGLGEYIYTFDNSGILGNRNIEGEGTVGVPYDAAGDTVKPTDKYGYYPVTNYDGDGNVNVDFYLKPVTQSVRPQNLPQQPQQKKATQTQMTFQVYDETNQRQLSSTTLKGKPGETVGSYILRGYQGSLIPKFYKFDNVEYQGKSYTNINDIENAVKYPESGNGTVIINLKAMPTKVTDSNGDSVPSGYPLSDAVYYYYYNNGSLTSDASYNLSGVMNQTSPFATEAPISSGYRITDVWDQNPSASTDYFGYEWSHWNKVSNSSDVTIDGNGDSYYAFLIPDSNNASQAASAQSMADSQVDSMSSSLDFYLHSTVSSSLAVDNQHLSMIATALSVASSAGSNPSFNSASVSASASKAFTQDEQSYQIVSNQDGKDAYRIASQIQNLSSHAKAYDRSSISTLISSIRAVGIQIQSNATALTSTMAQRSKTDSYAAVSEAKAHVLSLAQIFTNASGASMFSGGSYNDGAFKNSSESAEFSDYRQKYMNLANGIQLGSSVTSNPTSAFTNYAVQARSLNAKVRSMPTVASEISSLNTVYSASVSASVSNAKLSASIANSISTSDSVSASVSQSTSISISASVSASRSASQSSSASISAFRASSMAALRQMSISASVADSTSASIFQSQVQSAKQSRRNASISESAFLTSSASVSASQSVSITKSRASHLASLSVSLSNVLASSSAASVSAAKSLSNSTNSTSTSRALSLSQKASASAVSVLARYTSISQSNADRRTASARSVRATSMASQSKAQSIAVSRSASASRKASLSSSVAVSVQSVQTSRSASTSRSVATSESNRVSASKSAAVKSAHNVPQTSSSSENVNSQSSAISQRSSFESRVSSQRTQSLVSARAASDSASQSVEYSSRATQFSSAEGTKSSLSNSIRTSFAHFDHSSSMVNDLDSLVGSLEVAINSLEASQSNGVTSSQSSMNQFSTGSVSSSNSDYKLTSFRIVSNSIGAVNLRKSILLHTSPNFNQGRDKVIGILRHGQRPTIDILRTYTGRSRSGKRYTRYLVNVNGKRGYITGNQYLVQNAYYSTHDFRKTKSHQITVTNPGGIEAHSIKTNWNDHRTYLHHYRYGQTIHLLKVVKLGRMYRGVIAYHGHRAYVTVNRDFVKFR